MNITAPRSSSLFQVQSPTSQPVSSRPAEVTQRPQSAVAQEWARDSFGGECPCKLKAQRLGLS
jgi:hypothetical protein